MRSKDPTMSIMDQGLETILASACANLPFNMRENWYNQSLLDKRIPFLMYDSFPFDDTVRDLTQVRPFVLNNLSKVEAEPPVRVGTLSEY